MPISGRGRLAPFLTWFQRETRRRGRTTSGVAFTPLRQTTNVESALRKDYAAALRDWYYPAAAAGPVDLAGGDGWNHWEDTTEQQVFATGSQQSDPAAAADQPPTDTWDHWSADAEDTLPLDQRVVDALVADPPSADPWDHWPDSTDAEIESTAPVAASDLHPLDPWDHWSEFVEDIAPEDQRVADDGAPPADAWDHWADESDEDELDLARVADDPVVVADQPTDDSWDHWGEDLPHLVVGVSSQQEDAAAAPQDALPADAWAEDDADDQWDGASAPVGANAAAPVDTPTLQDDWEWASDAELLEFIVLDFPQVEEDPAAFEALWAQEEIEDDWPVDSAPVGADAAAPAGQPPAEEPWLDAAEDEWLGDSAPVVADVVAPVEPPGPADDWDHWTDELPVLVVPTGTQQEDVVAVVDPVPPQDEWLEEFEADEWDSAGQPVGADVVVVVDTPAPADAWDWVEPDLLEFIVLDFPQVEDDPRIDDAWPWFTDDTHDEWDGDSAPVSAVVADAPTQDAWTWAAEEDADDWWCALDYAVVGADFVAPPASQFFDDPLGFYAGDDAYEVPPDVSDSAPVGPDFVYVPPPTPPVEERRGGGGKGKRQRVAQAEEPTAETAKRWTTRELEDLDFIMALLASGALDG